MFEAFLFAMGLAVGGVIGWLWAANRVRRGVADLQSQLAVAETRLESDNRRFEEQKRLIEDQQKKLEATFESLSARALQKALQTNTEQFRVSAKQTLDTILDVFPPDTKFIPGHGHDCSMDDVAAYRRELLRTIELITEHIKAGKTVAQMRQERILREWESWSEFLPQLGTDYWIEAVHTAYASETP